MVLVPGFGCLMCRSGGSSSSCYSDEATVDPGVPHGTVMGPILSVCHINDLPNSVNSSVRLFTDDCLLHREINNENDHTTLQNDLKNLEKWASDWGMRFNAKKCYILSIKKKRQSIRLQVPLAFSFSVSHVWSGPLIPY
jgi:hypothetical protein